MSQDSSFTDWQVERGDSPILATAIHNGHGVRPELQERMILKEPDRLREEDPYTGRWTSLSPNRIILSTSRFEVDLNRPRAKAVYAKPEDAWGLNIWEENLSGEYVDRSLEKYDRFYGELKQILEDMVTKYGGFILYDIHSYNHRRNGAEAPPEAVEQNPEVNLGTGTLNKDRWPGVAETFMSEMRSFDYAGRSLDVRENVKFKGGWLSNWVHETFPQTGLCLAIEFKKFFMDEWTGEFFEKDMKLVESALKGTVGPVLFSAGMKQ